MADKISKEKRSWNMRRIRSKDTKPELYVRSALHRMGYRFRIHKKDLPGKPDIVLPKYQTVIFVHGCFWHRHENCVEASRPKTNPQYWEDKIIRTVQRDKEHKRLLKALHWHVITIWECEVGKNFERNHKMLTSHLKQGLKEHEK